MTTSLCGIEPTRHPTFGGKTLSIDGDLFVESHIYTYQIKQNGQVEFNKRPKIHAVIGSGKKLEYLISKKLGDVGMFSIGQPQLHWARALVGGEAVADAIMKDDEISKTVGGPFQVVRITTDGLQTQYIWPPNQKCVNVEVKHDREKTVIRNPSTNDEYIIYPIWEFPEKELHGVG